MLGKLWSYFKGFVFDTESTLKKLHEDRLGVAYSFLAVAAFLTIYTALIFAFIELGGTSPIKPWILTGPDHYKLQLFLQWPVFLAGTVLLAGMMYVFSKAWSLKGSFDDCLEASGFIIAIPTTVILGSFYLILTLAFLLGTYNPEKWLEFSLSQLGLQAIWSMVFLILLWSVEMTTTSIRKIFNAPTGKSVVIAAFSTLINFLFISTYIR